MNAKILTGLLAGALVTAMCLWPTEGLTMNADANKIYVPRNGDDWRKLPKNPNGWEAIPNAYAPISDIADWQKLVEKRRKDHWKPGKSAYKTAHSWFNSNPDLPREIKALLGGTAELLTATPEHETPLPGKGSGSHSDVLAFVNMRGARCAVTVEGKIDEEFDDTVDAWLKKASSESSRNNRTKRLNGIYDELGLTNPAAAQIRYQLLHRAAAAVIEAKRFNADCAAMIVQSFSPKHQWFEDFAEFLKLFGVDSVKRDTLYETGMPGMPLYFGWASPLGTVAVAETPAPQPAPAAPAPAKPEIQQVARVAKTAAPSPESVAPNLDKPQTNPLIENFVWILLGGLALVGIFFGVRKWKGSDADSKAAQYTENAPAQIAESAGWQKNVQNQLDIISSRVSHLFYMNKDAENRINGTKFEEYVMAKFRNPNFSLTDNRERYPDFVVDFSENGEMHRFAVECKWRRGFKSNGNIEFCTGTDLENYQKYETQNKRQTFIVLGVQHPADNPEQIYIIPAQSISAGMLHVKDLRDYGQNKHGDFSYESNEKVPLRLV